MLTVTFLGAVAVQSPSGRPLPLRNDKVLALLAYLAVEAGRAHTRASLAALLWPEIPDEAARNNLSQTLVRLRAALGDDQPQAPLLHITRQTIQWNRAGDSQVDVTAFARLARSDARADLEQAAALYRSAFLDGFSLPECEVFSEWLLLTREHLHQLALHVLEQLSEAALAEGAFAHAHAHARRQLTLDPWCERAYRQLMRALAASGQRAAALAEYERCRTLLAGELGIEPDPATTVLYEQLRAAKETRRQGDKEAAPLAPSRERSERLPFPPSRIRGDAPEPGRLYGRQREVAQLARWLLEERCQLVAVLGLGGVGKTTLAATVAHGQAAHFEVVVWRSLVNAPPLDELLHGALSQLEPGAPVELPNDPQAQIGLLLDVLRRSRCLLVLDNLESLLRADEPGVMRAGYEGYAQLLRAVGERWHQSCLLLTSRERPQGLARLEEDTPLVRLLRLDGLDAVAGTELLAARGLNEMDGAAGTLVQRYSGNPLALRLVAQTVREVFDGDIGAFLQTEAPSFDDIGAVLDQQLARLAPLERELLFWLAIVREPTPVNALRANLLRPEPPRAVVEAARALLRRSLVVQSGGLALQNVVTEYLSEQLIAQMAAELEAGPLDWLHRYALLTTDAAEYVRQSQLRLLVEPVARQLAAAHGIANVGSLIGRLLDALRDGGQRRPSYAAGNLLNLLTQLQIDIHGYDFSGLCVWQADLREVTAFDVNFAQSDLAHAAFSDRFDAVNSVAFSPDGALMAAGSSNGVVGAWRISDGQRHALFSGHRLTVWSVAFSPDGRVLASASSDATVRLWDTASGQTLQTLRGHNGRVVAVAFVPGTSLLASGGADGTLRLWDTRDGICQRVLDGHEGGICALAIDPAGVLVAAADAAGHVHLWSISDAERLSTLTHPQPVECVAFRADGGQLVSGCHDAIARVWDVGTGQTLRELEGHHGRVYSARWSSDGNVIATGSMDTTIRLWNARSGEPLRVLRGHVGNVNGLDWSPDGALLVSAGHDETIRVWSALSGDALRVLQGNAAGVLSLTFGSTSATLYSTQGHVVRLWDVQQRRRRRILRGHRDVVTNVSASHDGVYLASASRDGTVRVWDAAHGHPGHVLAGHTSIVTAVAWSPNGAVLASGSYDASVRLWDVGSGQLARSFMGHTGWVAVVGFSADGALLISGGVDGTVRLWDVAGGQLLHCLAASHQSAVRSVAVSPDGVLLAYASDAGVMVVDMRSGQPIHTLASGAGINCIAFSPDNARLATGSGDGAMWLWQREGWTARRIGEHAAWISAVSWSADGSLLASSSTVGEIKLWDGRTGAPAGELCDEGPYAGMNIIGASGITAAQRASLVTMGASDGGVAPDP